MQTHIPHDLLYTDQHLWVSVEGGTATIGITEYAQEALGDVEFVELPEAGTELAQADEAGAVESSKAAASIYAPVAGAVVEVNADLEDEPGFITSDCYGDGWLFRMKLNDKDELSELMTAEQYRQMLLAEG